MKIVSLVVAVATVLVVGCAPQFIDVPAKEKKALWVERDAILTHEAIAQTEQSEIVLSNVSKETRVGPQERVVWVSGVDLKNSKLQRTHERIDAKSSDNSLNVNAAEAELIKFHAFQVFGNSLSAKGQMSLQRFKTDDKSRYYIEFLNDGPMTEERVGQMLDAWKELASRLKDRGLNTSNVILGGAKYEQSTNAIVLVKVGK